jgi:hypothetical protein
MELQEFLSFKKMCFVCGGPMEMRVIHWSKPNNPIVMEHHHLYKMHDIIKFSHQSLSIFINLKKNIYTLLPNDGYDALITIDNVCKNNPTHYAYESQMMIFSHVSQRWGSIPHIDIIESFTINSGDIFMIVNSYASKTSTLSFFANKIHATLPLLDTHQFSYQEIENTIQIYLQNI